MLKDRIGHNKGSGWIGRRCCATGSNLEMIAGDHIAIYTLLALAVVCGAIVFWSIGAL